MDPKNKKRPLGPLFAGNKARETYFELVSAFFVVEAFAGFLAFLAFAVLSVFLALVAVVVVDLSVEPLVP
jgi:hypothetical protein